MMKLPLSFRLVVASCGAIAAYFSGDVIPRSHILAVQPVLAQTIQVTEEADQLLEQAQQLRLEYDQWPVAVELLQQALALYEETENTDGLLAATVALGQLYNVLGQAHQTLPLAYRSLDILHEAGEWQTLSDRYREQELLNLLAFGVAVGAAQEGDIQRYLEEKLAEFQSEGDRPREMMYLGKLATLFLSQDQPDQAIPLFQQQLSLAEDSEDAGLWELEALNSLMPFYVVHLSPSQLQEWEALRQELWTPLPINIPEGNDLANIEQANTEQANTEQTDLTPAEQWQRYEDTLLPTQLAQQRQLWQVLQALLAESDINLADLPLPSIQESPLGAIANGSGHADPQQEADQLFVQAQQLQRNGQWQAALDRLRQALERYEQIGDQASLVTVVSQLADGYVHTGQLQRALPFVFRSLSLFQDAGEWPTTEARSREVVLLSSLETIAVELQQMDHVQGYLDEKITQFQQQGDRPRELLYLGKLAMLVARQGDLLHAETLFRQQLDFAQTEEDFIAESEALSGLTLIYISRLSPEAQDAFHAFSQDVSLPNTFPDLTDEELARLTDAERQQQYIIAQEQALLEYHHQVWERLQSLVDESEVVNTSTPSDTTETVEPNPFGWNTNGWDAAQLDDLFNQYIGQTEQALEEAIAQNDWPTALRNLHLLIPASYAQENYDGVVEYSQILLELAQSPDTFMELGKIPTGYTPESLELFALYFLADGYYALGQEQEALDTAIRVSDRHQASTYRDTVLFPLHRIPLNLVIPGAADWNLQDMDGAIAHAQRVIALARLSRDRQREALALGALGYTYTQMEDFAAAQVPLEEALAKGKPLGDMDYQAYLLSLLVQLYLAQGNYRSALDAGEELLILAQQGASLVNDVQAEDDSDGFWRYGTDRTDRTRDQDFYCLMCVGQVYEALGHYQQALAFYQQVLDDVPRDSLINTYDAARQDVLASLGNTYFALGQDEAAIAAYRQSLDAFSTPPIEGLTGLSRAYLRVGELEQALEVASEGVRIARQQGYQIAIGSALPWLGDVYVALGQSNDASNVYLEALVIARALNAPQLEVQLLSRMARLWVTQEQPELAIAFYKQAVNQQEQLRQQIRTLSPELQQFYTEAIAPTYRELADVLLQQDRILEAQQVLELLKLQEVEDYLRTARNRGSAPEAIDALPPEAELLQLYDARLAEAVQLGQQLDQILALAPGDRTPDQERQRQAIEAKQRELLREFVDFTRTPQVVDLVAQLRRVQGGETLEPRLLRTLQDNLQDLNHSAVVLYPLVLDDRLELLLVTPYTPPIRRPVPVSRVELNQAIANFRAALEDPNSDATVPAQQLYNWLIRPIESALTEGDIDTIIYAPDNTLRYIPLAALYDSNAEQWLAEQYQINTITALSLTDFDRTPRDLRVLAGAFSSGGYTVEAGDRTFNFQGLPYAGAEVEALKSTIADTTSLFDANFGRSQVEAQMSDYSVLHFATHAAFLPGQPDESFIIFGDGTRATFRDVELWNLTNADLVVLSACETALGANGEELLGFGYLMQVAGARAAIASLWQVSDGGTQTLMDAFYTALNNGYSKTEALQRAQQALISGDETVLAGTVLSAEEGDRGFAMEIADAGTGRSLSDSGNLSHPYYWAPFILIGNGL